MAVKAEIPPPPQGGSQILSILLKKPLVKRTLTVFAKWNIDIYFLRLSDQQIG